jgi:uncharacterized protein (DUF362 family)
MSDTSLTRRQLLRRAAGAVAAAGAASAGGYLLYDPQGDAGLPAARPVSRQLPNYFERVDFSPSHPRISVAIGGEQALEKMIRAAVEGLDPARGMGRFIAKGDVVLIKPNVGFDRSPHLGATTHPQVLRWVIRLCKEAGAGRIIVADNPIESPEACFSKSGLRQVCDAEGAKVVLPAASFFETLSIRNRPPDPARGEVLARWSVFYRPLAEATKVIGLAPVKDHNLCSASMNLKNWYGLLGGRRNQFHQAIHDIVSDLALMVSPTLVIADGTRVMMRNGPTGGRLTDIKPGGEIGRPTVVAAVDPVACDAWCYRYLLGRDPARLAYLESASRKIGEQIASGVRRFGESDWQVYERQGLIATCNV